MALLFPAPSVVAQEYLTHLKGLKPEVNTTQTDSDWYIRAQVTGGVISGCYADQELCSNDAFPQNARHAALSNHLFTYFNRDFNPAQPADGPVGGTGASGTFAAAGSLQFIYEPNGNAYISNENVTIDASGNYSVTVQSVATGQNQNLLEGSPLTLSSPPNGFNAAAEVTGGNIADGTDMESDAEAAQAILTRIQNPITGGTASDYEQWAREADPSVVSANVIRYLFGLGTLGIMLSAGTTNIDTAIDNGTPIVLVPSNALIQIVQDYIDNLQICTDCVTVLPVSEVAVNVTIQVTYKSGTGSTIPSGQTLTQDQLVQREVSRAIYKTQAGGVEIGASGFVMADDINDVVGAGLGASTYTTGTLPILLDRYCEDLSATGPNLMILGYQVAVPGTITVVSI